MPDEETRCPAQELIDNFFVPWGAVARDNQLGTLEFGNDQLKIAGTDPRTEIVWGAYWPDPEKPTMLFYFYADGMAKWVPEKQGAPEDDFVGTWNEVMKKIVIAIQQPLTERQVRDFETQKLITSTLVLFPADSIPAERA